MTIKPAVLELHDGRKLEIDLYRISITEWRRLFDKDTERSEEDAIMGKVVGLSADEVGELSQPDYRLVMRTVLKKAGEPIGEDEEKNSPSASTSD